jgi:hypothetical protein
MSKFNDWFKRGLIKKEYLYIPYKPISKPHPAPEPWPSFEVETEMKDVLPPEPKRLWARVWRWIETHVNKL